MDAGGCCLARCIQSGQGGTATKIRAHSTHRVVCRRANWNQVHGDIDVVLHAGGVDARKACLHVLLVQMCEIEIDDRVFGVADFEFVNNRPGYHVTRGQFAHGVVLRHETGQLDVS